MRRELRCVWVAVLGLGLLAPIGASAGPPCRSKAIEVLRTASPEGFAIYQQMSQPDFFASWIDCADSQFDLSTAVHESTHYIAAETDTFPLVGGGAVRRPHEVSAFFPPARIADRFPHDDFAAIYLRQGKASSSTDLLYLLDELNAYSHDLATAVDLRALSAQDGTAVDHRDGLAALMAFVAVYAERAKASELETWRGLQAPGTARTLSALWRRAERVMASSCGIPHFGSRDRAYIRTAYAPDAAAAMADLLGRAPVRPTACLADVAEDREPSDDTIAAAPSIYRIDPQAFGGTVEGRDDEGAWQDRPHHPFNIEVGPGHRRHRDDDG